MTDPINPAHYAGRACADIGERLTANGYQVLKYVWRLGKKDDVLVELGKAVWYGESELALLRDVSVALPGMRTAPMVFGIVDPAAFLEQRLTLQTEFTRAIARMLWRGYNADEMQAIVEYIKQEKGLYEGS